jgi:hypothetical protein
MEKMTFIFSIIMFLFCLSCQTNTNENIDEIGENTIQLKNLVLSPCENNSKSSSYNSVSSSDVNEYIKFSSVCNDTLQVEQKFFVNCCTEEIDININSKGNNITIYITDVDGGCNCICPKIVVYSIGNLKENSTYNLTFIRNSLKYYTGKLLFTNHVESIINIEK